MGKIYGLGPRISWVGYSWYPFVVPVQYSYNSVKATMEDDNYDPASDRKSCLLYGLY